MITQQQLTKLNQDMVDSFLNLKDCIDNLDERLGGMGTKARSAETMSNRPLFAGYGDTKSAGQAFTTSEAYKRFLSTKQNVSDAVPFETKATLTSVSGGGNLLGGSAYDPRIVGATMAPTVMRDLLNVRTTTNNAIYYMEQLTYTNASEPVAEGTLKPESSMTFEERMSAVKTIAHHIPVTRQVIADVEGLQNHIDTQLMAGLNKTEELQILYGDGTGENLMGFMVHTGVQDAGKRLTKTHVDHIRHAITLASVAGDMPNGIVLNAQDWEDIELQKDTQGRYILATVATGGESRLWRVPVLVTSSMSAGDFLLGAFNTGATLWDREQAHIKISEHHADFFIRNMLSVLCEERVAFGIQKPISFVKGSFATT